MGKKLAALPKIALFYLWWFPTRFLGFSLWPRFAGFGRLGKHLRFADRASRRLARQVFYGMARFGPKLERRQAFLFRAVDVAMELFVLTTAVSRAKSLADAGAPEAKGATELADLFGRDAKRRVKRILADMSIFRTFLPDHDAAKTEVGKRILAGDHRWLERGTMGVPYSIEDLTPPTVAEILEARADRTSGDAPAEAEPEPAGRSAGGTAAE
jgi:hypothetical protein